MKNKIPPSSTICVSIFSFLHILQEWLSPPGRLVLAYKTEEIVTADSVVVVPKPVMQEPKAVPEQSVCAAAPLGFPQCQLSYVGLPEMQEAILPSPQFSPGSLSYTKLPCPFWPGHSEVPSSTDRTQTCVEDSGCSCEEVTQSQESSPVSSPARESPPVCSCTDYCILNKTAEGFTPILVSRGPPDKILSLGLLQEDPNL